MAEKHWALKGKSKQVRKSSRQDDNDEQTIECCIRPRVKHVSMHAQKQSNEILHSIFTLGIFSCSNTYHQLTSFDKC